MKEERGRHAKQSKGLEHTCSADTETAQVSSSWKHVSKQNHHVFEIIL
jgi:hypothetical protein